MRSSIIPSARPAANIDKSSRFPYRRAFGRKAAPHEMWARRPFLSILQTDSKQQAVELARKFLRVGGDGECELRQLYEAHGSQPCVTHAHEAAEVALRG